MTKKYRKIKALKAVFLLSSVKDPSSVLFAFITNKIFVFEQRIWSFKIVVKEMRIFFTARIATGILDMMLMWVFVDILLISEMGTKVIVNVVVILLNYILSKWLVFQ